MYHGFATIPETETEGWIYGAITDYESLEPQTEGDGFVVAPDGSRAGIVWATDGEEFFEILPPDEARWGVYGVRFHKPVSGVSDVVQNFRAVLPLLQRRHRELSA